MCESLDFFQTDNRMNQAEMAVGWLSAPNAFVTKKHQDDKVIIFDRAGCIFGE